VIFIILTRRRFKLDKRMRRIFRKTGVIRVHVLKRWNILQEKNV
jgi:hypothetical protein